MFGKLCGGLKLADIMRRWRCVARDVYLLWGPQVVTALALLKLRLLGTDCSLFDAFVVFDASVSYDLVSSAGSVSGV